MEIKKPPFYKRVIAYVVDLLIVTILASLISLIFTDSKQYEIDSKKMIDIANQYKQGEITKEEYLAQYDEINYAISQDSVTITIITCVVALVYYVLMCYYCHGITLGKYMVKIKVSSSNDRKLTIFNYLLRSLIANMILLNVINVILIKVLDKQSFISTYGYINYFFTILILVSIIVMVYLNDGRGLHDLISNTEVIYINLENKDEVRKTEDTKDAVILEEKKTKKEGEVDGKRVIRTRNSSKRKS